MDAWMPLAPLTICMRTPPRGMKRADVFVVLVLSAGCATTKPIEAGPTPVAEITGSLADSATFHAVKADVDWRSSVRVTTRTWGYLRLYDPVLTREGLDYDNAEPVLGEGRAPPRPLPLPEVLEIEVRRGSVPTGMAIGALGGALFVGGLGYDLWRGDAGAILGRV